MQLIKHFWIILLLPLALVMGMVLPMRVLVILAVVGIGSMLFRRAGILMLMVTLSASSQEFGSYGNLPLLSGSGSGSSGLESLLPSGIWHDWNAATLTPGNVTLWQDTNMGWNFRTISGTPSADGTNVHFTGAATMQMTNLTFSSGTPQSFLFVGSFDSPISAAEMIWCTANAGGEIFVGLGDSTHWYLQTANVTRQQAVNTTFDLLYAGGTAGGSVNYTNGSTILAGAIAAGGGTGIDFLGSANTGTPFTGRIYRMIMWTNSTAFTAVQVSNIHYYAQQKYSVLP